ncbi:MAG: hypothetical protein HWE24_04790 [Oceanospirillaceae bacterium]|nr:hypothetical protein [Oceanospirillaceae bacterium]
MFLSPYLKIKKVSFFTIHGSSVLFLLLLQIAAWYPFLSDAQESLKQQSRLEYRAVEQWRKTQVQAKQLALAQFESASWAQHYIVASDQNIPTQWGVKGSASIRNWQILLEQIETQFHLVLLSVLWQREANGNWQGTLEFGIRAPKENRAFHNWLPAKIQADHFSRNDWQLLSTMRIGQNTSALLAYKERRHWVRQGSWLAEAGLTVSSVSSDQVVLLAKNGAKQVLLIREQGGSHE